MHVCSRLLSSLLNSFAIIHPYFIELVPFAYLHIIYTYAGPKQQFYLIPGSDRTALPVFDVGLGRADTDTSIFLQCWVSVQMEKPAKGDWTPLLLATLERDDTHSVLMSTITPAHKRRNALHTSGMWKTWVNESICAQNACQVHDVTRANTFALTYHLSNINESHCSKYSCNVEYLSSGTVQKKVVHLDEIHPFCMHETRDFHLPSSPSQIFACAIIITTTRF